MRKINLNEVSQIYKGKQNCCRCGCGGKYVSTSYMISPRSDVDDAVAQDLLNKFNELQLRHGLCEDEETYKEVSLPAGRCITIYLDEVKSFYGRKRK